MNKKEAVTAAANLFDAVNDLVDADEISASEVNGYIGTLESIARELQDFDEFDWLFEVDFEPLIDNFFWCATHSQLVETFVEIRSHTGRIKMLGGWVDEPESGDRTSDGRNNDININLTQNANANASATASASSSLQVEMLISDLREELQKTNPDKTKLAQV